MAKKGSILVVDDEEVMRDVLDSLLVAEGYQVEMARTGEEGLDQTVPPHLTRRYLDCLPGARHAVLERTGHMGTVTRPEAFAALVSDFVSHTSAAHVRKVS